MPKNDNDVQRILQHYQECLTHLEDAVNSRLELSPKLPHSTKLNEYVMKYSELDDAIQALIQAALKARLNAYCPYSNFKVGAAFETHCGLVYSGCNIENVAFSPTCCAERTALVKAISEGHKRFSAGAVVATGHKGGYTMPCGVCRQFINEFVSGDIPLYIGIACDEQDCPIEEQDEIIVTSIFNLLPHSFTNFSS